MIRLKVAFTTFIKIIIQKQKTAISIDVTFRKTLSSYASAELEVCLCD